MEKRILIAAAAVLCGALAACSFVPSEDPQQPAGSPSPSMSSGAETASGNDTSEVPEPSSAADGENSAELAAFFQEKINKIALSGIFSSDFDESSSEQDGYYLYTSGCYILGDSLEETYQYAARTIQNDSYEDYPYTSAQVMDSALQEYFAIPSETLHNLIGNYDADIDGYWAPMGGGGATAMTTLRSCQIDGNTALLSCETRTSAASEEEPGTFSTVTMVYSDEYGWRFSSCIVL